MSTCALCKEEILESEPEAWTTPDDEVVHISLSMFPSAIADTSIGELEICESCYLKGLPSYLTPEDLAEIHYQFGLEYAFRNDRQQSFESLKQALNFSETADILAALASSESELGHTELAVKHYKRALEIEPGHFMSEVRTQGHPLNFKLASVFYYSVLSFPDYFFQS